MARIEVKDYKTKPSRHKTQLVYMVLPVVVVALVLIVFLIGNKPKTPTGFPAAVKNKAVFTIFYPSDSSKLVTANLASVNYDDSDHGMSYRTSVNSKAVVVTEQATPDVFSQNGVYDYKLNQAHQYANFSTNTGSVYLTKPTEANGQTVAWDNVKGTLILVHALGNLSQGEWQTFFNSLVAVN